MNLLFGINLEFIINLMEQLELLLDKFMEVLTLEDILSICTENATERAKHFELVVKNIEVTNLPPCFWCCMEGRKRAMLCEGFMTDQGYTNIKRLFDFCSQSKHKYEHFMVQFSFAISRLFASYARGIAHVFIGTDKKNEKPGLVTGLRT